MFRRFLQAEDGTVAVDWVAVTGGVVLLAFAVIYGIYSTGGASTSSSINATLVATGTAVQLGSPPDQGSFH